MFCFSIAEFHTEEIRVDEEEPTALPPLLDEAENAEKLLRKPTKFEMMRRFKSKKTKRKSQIIRPGHLTEVSGVCSFVLLIRYEISIPTNSHALGVSLTPARLRVHSFGIILAIPIPV